MNNEERILSMLEQMNDRLDNVQSDIKELKTDVQVLKSDVQGLKSDVIALQVKVQDLDEKVDKVHYSQITVELEWFPKVKLALEGVTGAIDKNTEQDKQIDVLENRSDNHGIRIFALESTIKQ